MFTLFVRLVTAAVIGVLVGIVIGVVLYWLRK